MLINPDGTLDFSHFSVANNNPRFLTGISAQDFSHAFGKGTRSEYLDEYVVGFEHEFGNSGVIFSARYNDRRIKPIPAKLRICSSTRSRWILLRIRLAIGIPQQGSISALQSLNAEVSPSPTTGSPLIAMVTL